MVKFAAPLKSMLRVLLDQLGISFWEIERYIEGDWKEKIIPQIGKTSRFLMETIGDGWGRDTVNPNLWLSPVRNKIKWHLARDRSVVVDDIRRSNEADLVEEYGNVYRVIRPYRLTEEDFAKKSPLEGQLNCRDFGTPTIWNLSDIPGLRAQVDQIIMP